jgi:hypothetical protein
MHRSWSTVPPQPASAPRRSAISRFF